MNKKSQKATEAGKKLIQSVYGAAGIIIVLAAINLMFFSGNYWFIYPAFFIGLGLVFQLFTYFGHKAAERYEQKQLEKQKEQEEHLELKALEQMKRNEKLNWDERDFV